MNEFMNNRYVQIAGLIVGLSILFFLLLWMVLVTTRFEIPLFVPIVMSVGTAIWLVWKFLAYRIG